MLMRTQVLAAVQTYKKLPLATICPFTPELLLYVGSVPLNPTELNPMISLTVNVILPVRPATVVTEFVKLFTLDCTLAKF